jgi:transcriptional regulator with XRE-family HTH domain
MQISKRLEAVRATVGLTQKEFAERLGLSLRSYQNYAQGERDVPASVFRLLRNIFQIDPSWMWDGPGHDNPRRVTRGTIDRELLARSEATVNAALAGHNRPLTPEQQGYLVAHVYDFYAQNEGAPPLGGLIDSIMKSLR